MSLSVPLRPHSPIHPIISAPIKPSLARFHLSRRRVSIPMSSNSMSPKASWTEEQNGPVSISPVMDAGGRIGEVKRVTKETNVFVKLNLDGTGVADSSSSIPFLDHMLDQIASHGLFDVHVRATGDIHIDDHHTNEDVALALGTALLQALGDRKGINRFGDFTAPLDEALVHVTLDLSGRPHLSCDLSIPTERVGTYDTQSYTVFGNSLSIQMDLYPVSTHKDIRLVEHFFQSLVNTSGMTLHIRQLAGKNSHHIIEATFKAFARALRQAAEHDPRRINTVPRNSVLEKNVVPGRFSLFSAPFVAPEGSEVLPETYGWWWLQTYNTQKLLNSVYLLRL
ncbi:Imidazoleglycerol-phosphate dehydratase, chloroplastic-like protein [Drosera capensis]